MGLHAEHPLIFNADPIHLFWKRLISFLDKFIVLKEQAILVSWNGSSCDFEWIYRLTQAVGETLTLQPRVKYFLDTYRGIESTKGCKINKNNLKLQSYSLGSVYERVIGETLSNAHCSLFDAKDRVSIVICIELHRV